MIGPIQKILLATFGLCAALNVVQLSGRIVSQETAPKGTPLHSLTGNFTGLETAFRGMRRAGYYTDKNMDIPLAIAQFEQAQYVLAPTVLDLNNTSYPLVIFDCTTPAVAMAKIKELGFKPLAANNGIILAFNPAFSR